MSTIPPTLLSATRTLVQLVKLFNLALVAGTAAALIATFVVPQVFTDFFAVYPERADPPVLLATLRVWMALGVPVLLVANLLYRRLLDIIDAVRAGEAFAPANAARLTTIARCLLVGQVFDLMCGAFAATMNAAGSRIDWHFSPIGWIAVLLVFVLARVFEEGAATRAELGEMI